MLPSFVLFLFLPSAICAVLRVPETHASLRTAVSAAVDGDTIRLGIGIFGTEENCGVVIDKGISIQGAGVDQSVIDCGYQSRCLVVIGVSGPVLVSGIHFRKCAAPKFRSLQNAPREKSRTASAQPASSDDERSEEEFHLRFPASCYFF